MFIVFVFFDDPPFSGFLYIYFYGLFVCFGNTCGSVVVVVCLFVSFCSTHLHFCIYFFIAVSDHCEI